MTQHQGIEKPEILVENIQNEPSGSPSWLAASVLVGAILISGSVLYSAKMILKKMDSTSGQVVLSQQAATPTAQQQAAAAQTGQGNIQVTERSDAPAIGSKSAKVTMIEFSDFQCPYCQSFFKETYGQIKSKYIDTGKVRLVFRHFPLPFHQNAEKAAEAAECANKQGKFFEYHDLLFKNAQSDGTGLAASDLKKYADQLGLNSGTLGFGKNKFNQCLDKSETASVVKKDVSDGTAAGVSGTPSFIINGKLVVGAQPYASFEQVIEAALK